MRNNGKTICAAAAAVCMLVGAAAAQTPEQLERYFEEIPYTAQYKGEPVYINSLGSDFCDAFNVSRYYSYDYGVLSLDSRRQWLAEPGRTFKRYPSNGIRLSGWNQKWYDRHGKELRDLEEKTRKHSVDAFSSGVAMDRVTKASGTVTLQFLDARAEPVYTLEDNTYQGMEILSAISFRNGILELVCKEKSGAQASVLLDRNFREIRGDMPRIWRDEQSPLEKAGFVAKGDDWLHNWPHETGTRLLDLEGNLVKSYPGWHPLNDLMIVDMAAVQFHQDCGHIVLGKGAPRAPEYLILKNKTYPYTEYGDIRFDSVRPTEKNTAQRVAGLYQDRMVMRKEGGAVEGMGIMDLDGNWVVEPNFREIGPFHNELAPARDASGRYGYLTKEGDWALEPVYEQADAFGCGYAAVVRGGVPMYIDVNGNEVRRYAPGAVLGRFSERVAWVTQDGQRTLVDMEFQPQFSGRYDAVEEYRGGVCKVQAGGKTLVLDLDGNTRFEVPEGMELSAYRDEFAVACKDGAFFQVNKAGAKTAEYPGYTHVTDLGNGLLLGQTKAGDVNLFDLFGDCLRYWEHTGVIEVDDGTVLLVPEDRSWAVPEDGSWFTAVRKTDDFAFWDQTLGSGRVIAMKEGDNRVFIDGKLRRIDQENPGAVPEMKDGRMMVPLRLVSNSLGYYVYWYDPKISIGKNETWLGMELQSSTLQIEEGDTVSVRQMDAAPYEKNGRSMVPLRMVAEQLGQQVYWDESGLVLIKESPRNPSREEIQQYLALWEES